MFLLFFGLTSVVRSVRVQTKIRRADVAWHGFYGACSVGCGRGTSTLTEMMCKKTGYMAAAQEAVTSTPVAAARELCEADLSLEKPPSSIECVSDDLCELRLAQEPPDSKCGWKEVFCAEQGQPNPEDSSRDPLAEFCASARSREKDPLPDKMDFKYRNGLVNSGCPQKTLESMCVLTMNQVSTDKPFGNYMDGLKQALYRAEDGIKKCDADVVVLAVQEMTNNYKDMFHEFATESFLTGLKTTIQREYEEVGRCGGEISSGLVVLAKSAVRGFIAPFQGSFCTKDDNKYGAKGAWTNTKGTAFLELFTVRGLLLAASTHSTHGDDSSPRLDMITNVAQHITDLQPAMVAWGGDFNMRTEVDTVQDELTSAGTPHPEPSELSESQVDETPPGNYNPEAAYDLLVKIPDTFGGGKTLQQVIQASSGGSLEEVPGVKNLCPTYKKMSSSGSWKPNGNTVPGTANRFGFGGTKQNGWSPAFACKAPKSPHGVEFYPNPLGGAKWPKHAPSWTERVVVHASAASKCKPPQKAVPLSTDDHDALFVYCPL